MESEIDVLRMLEITFVSFVLGFPFILPKGVPRGEETNALCLIILLHFKSDKVGDGRGACCIYRRLWDNNGVL